MDNLIGPGANLTGADLNDADLNGADLTGATLTNVKSGGITATGTPPTLPTDWKLINGYLIGPDADLTGANLNDADLTNANLNGANLNGADLTGASLYVQSGSITGSPSSLPTSWKLIYGYLMGPGTLQSAAQT